jgi:hypothetical protein
MVTGTGTRPPPSCGKGPKAAGQSVMMLPGNPPRDAARLMHKGHDLSRGGQSRRSVCLAACVSGGLKSRSARGHGSISKSGGNASLAEGGGRYGEVYTGTKAKAGHSQDGPAAASCNLSEDRASPARGSLKGLRSTTGSYSKGAIPERNRSAQAGEWSSLHYGGEGALVPPPRTTVCAGDTVGKRHT